MLLEQKQGSDGRFMAHGGGSRHTRAENSSNGPETGTTERVAEMQIQMKPVIFPSKRVFLRFWKDFFFQERSKSQPNQATMVFGCVWGTIGEKPRFQIHKVHYTSNMNICLKIGHYNPNGVHF